MLTQVPADFIKTFVTDLNKALGELKPNSKLTSLQQHWLGFCLTAILLTNTVCWAKFERASLGKYQVAALSWMFRCSKINWNYLLLASVTLILKSHGITEGTLVVDEEDFIRHIEYIHYNPVKHGYVKRVEDWNYSFFHHR